MDRSSKQKINKDTRALNDTLDQMDFTDVFRALYPKAAEYIFFSRAHGTFSRRDHILGHKSGLNRYQKFGIIPSVFPDHSPFKLELDHKRKFGKNSNTRRLKSIRLKNEWANQEINKQVKEFMETKENENTTLQNLWDAAKAVPKREV